MTDKISYVRGQEAAYSTYGMPPNDQDQDQQQPAKPLLAQHLPPKQSPSWLPALGVGAASALATYHGMRTPKFSNRPNTRAVQEFGAEKGLHRVVDVNPISPELNQGKMWDLYDKTRPQVSKPGADLDTLNKMKLWLHEGPNAIPIATSKKNGKGRAYIPGSPNGVNVDGYVMDRHMFNNGLIRGGRDLEGSAATQKALTAMDGTGKNFESELLQSHAPGSHPATLTRVGNVYQPGDLSTPEARINAARDLQTKVHAHMGSHGIDDYLMKPSRGFASGGQFPTTGEDWGKHQANYEKHFSDPKNVAEYERLKAKSDSGVEANNYIDDHNLYHGHVMNSAIRDPSSVQVQHKMPGALGEYRVHAMQGVVAPGMTADRGIFEKRPNVPDMTPEEMEHMHSFVENTLTKLPENYSKGMYGFDVMHFRDPHTGQPNFKIVEMNQHVHPTLEDSVGATSGYLDGGTTPGAGWTHQRAVTGRHAHPVALGAAAGMGLAGVAATRAYQNLTQDDDDQQPHPVG